MPRHFGDKLRYLRQQRQLTQRDLAQQLTRVRQAHIANIESNRRGPSLQFVILVAGFFQVTTDYLLRDEIPIENIALHTSTRTIAQTDLPNQFGAKLRHLRMRDSLTQLALAQRLGLRAHAHVSLLESGQHEPSVDLIVQVSDFFEVTTDYLLWEDVLW